MILFSLIMLGVGFIAGTVTIVLYISTQRKWYKNAVGKIILTMSMVVTAFYGWYFLVTTYPTIPGRTLIRSILFTAMTAAIVYRMFAFIRLMRLVKLDAKSGAQPPVGAHEEV